MSTPPPQAISELTVSLKLLFIFVRWYSRFFQHQSPKFENQNVFIGQRKIDKIITETCEMRSTYLGIFEGKWSDDRIGTKSTTHQDCEGHKVLYISHPGEFHRSTTHPRL